MENAEYKVTLEAARVNAGLSVEMASSKIGISKSTLARYEKGKTSPTMYTLLRMCKVYNVPLGSISLPCV